MLVSRTGSLQTTWVFDVSQLALANHVHGFDAADQDPGAAKSLHSEHGPRDAFDGAMVLLDAVVQVL